MAVGVIVEVRGGTREQYEEIAATLFPDGRLPDGWVVHIAGPIDGGWRVINVVHSREEFEVFTRDQLVPAAREAGDAALPEVTFFPVANLLRG